MPISITPTLSSSGGYLYDIRDQIMHSLATFVYTPENTSEIWESLSLMSIVADKGHDRLSCASRIHSILQDHFRNKFNDCQVVVNCSTEDYDPINKDSRYTVKVEVTITNLKDDTQSIPAVVSSKLKVDPHTKKLELIWDRQNSDITTFNI